MNIIKFVSIIKDFLAIASLFPSFPACRRVEKRYTLSIFHKKEDVIL